MLCILFFHQAQALGGGDSGHTHQHHKNDVGLGAYPVYFLKEKHLGYGMHIHYIRNIGHSRFGLGMSAERVFGEHKHNNLGIIVAYSPLDMLKLSLSPGISLNDHDHAELDLSLHFEIVYAFDLKGFHLGPLLEFATDRHDNHISLGLHLGIGF